MNVEIQRTDRRVVLDDGAETLVTQWGKRGPLMLCIHGMTSSRLGWRRLAQTYTSRFRVVAYDQRGHGESADVVGPMTIARCVRDLENVARALDEPVDVLIGHSWGGAVAVRGGARVAQRTVAIDPVAHRVSDTWFAEYLDELAETFALHGEARDARVRLDHAALHPDDLDGKVHAMHAMRAQALIGLRDQNSAADWDLDGALAAFERPLLLALADPSESIIDPEPFERLRSLRKPNVTVDVFAGEGHSLHRSALEAFTRAVDRFLARTA